MAKVRALRGLIYSQYDNEVACARAMKWDKRRLSKITNGNKMPDLEEIDALSTALNCPISDIARIFLPNKSPNRQQNDVIQPPSS